MEILFANDLSRGDSVALFGDRGKYMVERSTSDSALISVFRNGDAVYSVRCSRAALSRKARIFNKDGKRVATVKRSLFSRDRVAVVADDGDIEISNNEVILNARAGRVTLGHMTRVADGIKLSADDGQMPFLIALAVATQAVTAIPRRRSLRSSVLRVGSALATAIAVCSTTALFAACETFHTDVTIGELPAHIDSVSVTCNGESPIKWEGKYYLFDYGDEIDVRVKLEDYYELGDCKMFVNGREAELDYDYNIDAYVYSFVINVDIEITFDGVPEMSSRELWFASHAADSGSGAKFITIDGWEQLGLKESYSFIEIIQGSISVEIPQDEGLSFTLYSEDYRHMPTADSARAQVATIESAEPFFDGTRGGTRFVIAAAKGDGQIVLSSQDAQPEVASAFDPDDMFFTVTVGGETPDPEIGMDALIGGELAVELAPKGIELYRQMKAQGVPLTVTVNGTVLDDAKIVETDDSVVITAALAPAYKYADGLRNGLFNYTVSTSISEFAASDAALAVRVSDDASFGSAWGSVATVVSRAEEQQSLIYHDDEGNGYYLADGYVVFDVWVPVGTPDGIPSFTFIVESVTSNIYDNDDQKPFLSDKSAIKIARTDSREHNIAGLEGWFAVLYKVYVSPSRLNEGGLEIYFTNR